jgi:hypothetical protein
MRRALKPYFVEMVLKINVLVMAESELDAHSVAEGQSERLLRLHGDGLCAEEATELASLEQLAALDRSFDGEAKLFGEDGRQWKLKDVLPEKARHEDARTLSLFDGAAG